jgi:hypothetical protein
MIYRWYIDDIIERAEAAVVEVLRSFKIVLFFGTHFGTHNGQTSCDDCMPITTASAIRRVHHHAQRRHLFNLPNLSSFTPSFSGNLEPQTYHERKILPSVFFASMPIDIYLHMSS